jgi:hypothetical protein
MCQACVIWEQGKLKTFELDRAITELINDQSSDEELYHFQELIEKANKDNE